VFGTGLSSIKAETNKEAILPLFKRQVIETDIKAFGFSAAA
jgi:hypothetical protein